MYCSLQCGHRRRDDDFERIHEIARAVPVQSPSPPAAKVEFSTVPLCKHRGEVYNTRRVCGPAQVYRSYATAPKACLPSGSLMRVLPQPPCFAIGGNPEMAEEKSTNDAEGGLATEIH